MEQKDANAIVTEQPTPEGQPITTDMVFELFGSLVPDSPWAARLRKMQTIFNLLATGATKLTTVPGWSLGDQIYDVKERECLGWDGPDVTQFSEGVSDVQAGLALMQREERIEPVEPLPDQPIDVLLIASTVGAVVSLGDDDTSSAVAFNFDQLNSFLAEYRRQLIEGLE